jgi:hypothetical protein
MVGNEFAEAVVFECAPIVQAETQKNYSKGILFLISDTQVVHSAPCETRSCQSLR